MPDKKMTAKDIMEEFGLNQALVYRILQDEELPTQTYCKPKFVLRSELLKYFSVRHDYLCN